MEVIGRSVLILPDGMPEKTAGGIAVPATAKDKPIEGRIVACGRECEEVTVGDRVIYKRKSASIILVEDIEHDFIIEDQISYIYGRDGE